MAALAGLTVGLSGCAPFAGTVSNPTAAAKAAVNDAVLAMSLLTANGSDSVAMERAMVGASDLLAEPSPPSISYPSGEAAFHRISTTKRVAANGDGTHTVTIVKNTGSGMSLRAETADLTVSAGKPPRPIRFAYASRSTDEASSVHYSRTKAWNSDGSVKELTVALDSSHGGPPPGPVTPLALKATLGLATDMMESLTGTLTRPDSSTMSLTFQRQNDEGSITLTYPLLKLEVRSLFADWTLKTSQLSIDGKTAILPN